MAERGEEVDDMEEDIASEESEQEGPSQAASKQKGKFPCLICKKAVKAGVRCNACHLWVHTKCQGISKELFAILKNPGKFGGAVCWNCDSCLASAVRLDDRMKALESSHREVETRLVRTENTVQEAVLRVEKVERRQDRVEDLLEREKERARVERVVEMRERELRKKNVVVHRMEEAGDWATTAEDRRNWDTDSCVNMFHALKLDWNKEAIRFCRRIGERGEDPRPMVVGLNREAQKEELLDKTRYLKDTQFAEIGVVPDLTQEQRRDESDMVAEAERRNTERSEEELAKNLIWRVVGRKGEKRLLKTVERDEDRNRGQRRGGLLPRGGASTWIPVARGGTRGGVVGGARGGAGGGAGGGTRGGLVAVGGPVAVGRDRWRGGSRGRGAGAQIGEEGDREQLLQLVRNGAAGNRTRINSKRVRDGEEGEEEDRTQPVPPQLAQ